MKTRSRPKMPRLGEVMTAILDALDLQIYIFFLDFLELALHLALFSRLCLPLAFLHIFHTMQQSWHGHSRCSVENKAAVA
jgi:hypothetical protein